VSESVQAAVLPVGNGPANADRLASLNLAFSSFAATAASLEDSYAKLQTEVHRLRVELEDRNAELCTQLEENRSIRESLHRLFEGLPCGVIVTSQAGRMISANPAARHLFAIDESGELPEPLRKILLRSGRAAGAHNHLDLEQSRDDALRWIKTHWAPLESERDQQMVFTLFDITEARREENQRERLERQKALASMAVLLAHEVRNPLGSLELFAGLLRDTELTAEQAKWVEQMQAGLRLLASTVNNVLQFHSLPAPSMGPTPLGSLLEWVRDFLTPIAQQSKVTLCVSSDLAGVIVMADGPRLEQVLLNLGLNALRAMPDGGTLTFRGCLRQANFGAKVEIEVSDTGAGVEESLHRRIFEPGFSSCPGSAGLGLAVCKSIVEQHGGTIEVARQERPGATFVLRLPAKESA
jgi:two-component system, sensor histidine kinase FlrB